MRNNVSVTIFNNYINFLLKVRKYSYTFTAIFMLRDFFFFCKNNWVGIKRTDINVFQIDILPIGNFRNCFCSKTGTNMNLFSFCANHEFNVTSYLITQTTSEVTRPDGSDMLQCMHWTPEFGRTTKESRAPVSQHHVLFNVIYSWRFLRN